MRVRCRACGRDGMCAAPSMHPRGSAGGRARRPRRLSAAGRKGSAADSGQGVSVTGKDAAGLPNKHARLWTLCMCHGDVLCVIHSCWLSFAAAYCAACCAFAGSGQGVSVCSVRPVRRRKACSCSKQPLTGPSVSTCSARKRTCRVRAAARMRRVHRESELVPVAPMARAALGARTLSTPSVAPLCNPLAQSARMYASCSHRAHAALTSLVPKPPRRLPSPNLLTHCTSELRLQIRVLATPDRLRALRTTGKFKSDARSQRRRCLARQQHEHACWR